jgi:hypothetical protein
MCGTDPARGRLLSWKNWADWSWDFDMSGQLLTGSTEELIALE